MGRLNEVAPLNTLQLFSERELEFLISGNREYDMVRARALWLPRPPGRCFQAGCCEKGEPR
jgi:hypothetical protein